MVDTTFSEEKIVERLIDKFEEFSSYYKNERSKITNDVIWVKTDKLPKGIHARSTRTEDANYILLRKLPYNLTDAHLIAHELQHIVHDDHYKIPTVGTTNPKDHIHNISSALNSSVHDRLVNRDLLEYNFDICAEFEDEIIESKKVLTPIKTTPDHDLDKTLWAVNYASKKFDYDFITSEYEFEDNSFFDWFDKRYPDILERSEQIYNTLKQIDLNSNDSMKEYFSWFISTYNLDYNISLKK